MTHSSSPQSPADRERLNLSTKVAYGAGDLGPAITANILVFYLLRFFTNVAGLPPGLAGSVLAIGKIADAVNDPITGILSDRSRSRWGRRIPWILWGAVPFAILFVLQWIVPRFSDNEAVNNWWLFGYYVLIGILFNIAYTIVNLPYTALTPELTQNYDERTQLNSFRFSFSIGGSILSLILAGLVFSFYSGEATGEGYFVLGILCAMISTIAIFWCALRIQERGAVPILSDRGKRLLGITAIAAGAAVILYSTLSLLPAVSPLLGNVVPGSLSRVAASLMGLLLICAGWTLVFAHPEPHLAAPRRADVASEATAVDSNPGAAATPPTAEPLSFWDQLRIVFRNKPFLYVIGIYLCSWLAVQLTASILIYFVVSWMGLAEAEFPKVAVAVQGTALIMLFVWKSLSERVGKKAVYFMGTGIWIVAQAGLFLLQPGQVGLMYVLAILAGIGVSVAYLIPWSMVPDVIEFDELTTGQRREGIFYGFMVLLQKMGLALAIFLVGQALGWAGFIESVAGEPLPAQPDSALFAIRIAIGPLPTVALIGGLVLAYFYPITREVHAEILLKLKERQTTQ